MNRYFILKNGTQIGPITTDQLLEMRVKAEVDITDLYWTEGMTDWRQLSEFTAPEPLQNHIDQESFSPIKTPKSRFKKRYFVIAGLAIFILFKMLSCQAENAQQRRNAEALQMLQGFAGAHGGDGNYQPNKALFQSTCTSCGGSGKSSKMGARCGSCSGKGTVITPSGYVITCNVCSGSGQLLAQCLRCGGTGRQ